MNLRRWVLFGLAAIVCRAQAQPPEPEVVTHQEPATFSSRVNLVSVPVVVRDKEGNSIGGLKQEDFQLSDKGKPQVITKFTLQTGEGAAAAIKTPAARSTETNAPPPVAVPPVLPDRYVAYFFDDIHMLPGDLLNARKAAAQHLDKALDGGMRAGIFTTSGRTTLSFTDDVAELHKTLNKIQPWTPINDKTTCPPISYYIADVLVNREHSLSPVLGISANSPLALEIFNETA